MKRAAAAIAALHLGCLDLPERGTRAPEPCRDFARVVCAGLDPFIPDCRAEVERGWVWIDDRDQRRTLGGCGTIARVFECYMASATVTEATLDAALHACSSFEGWPEPTR